MIPRPPSGRARSRRLGLGMATESASWPGRCVFLGGGPKSLRAGVRAQSVSNSPVLQAPGAEVTVIEAPPRILPPKTMEPARGGAESL